MMVTEERRDEREDEGCLLWQHCVADGRTPMNIHGNKRNRGSYYIHTIFNKPYFN